MTSFGGIMIHDLSGKEKSALLGAVEITLGLMGEGEEARGWQRPEDRPLSAEETAGFAVGDPFREHGLPGTRHENASGKKQCGLCDFKTGMKKKWECLHTPKYACPVPIAGVNCVGFRSFKLSKARPTQSKKKRPLGIPGAPPGVSLLYFERPTGCQENQESSDKPCHWLLPSKRCGHPSFPMECQGRSHQGVVTVAWIESSPGILHLGCSFCSPKDRWCKATGRDMAITRLYEHPVVIPFLYSPKRTVHDVVRAILTHDFGRIAALSPGVTMWERVPSWTKTLAKRLMGGTERERRGQGKTLGEKLAWLRAKEIYSGLFSEAAPIPPEAWEYLGGNKPTVRQMVARLMRDITQLEDQ